MSVGTITLTNNSKTVTGKGTSFVSEVKPGDFIYCTVGQYPYTLVVLSVDSDVKITLSVDFDGPTSQDLAFSSVPASLQVAITQKILNNFSQVGRGRILDFDNWQKIYSNAQTVTVTRPDRSTFSGPSWGYLSDQLANKVGKDDLKAYAKNGSNSDITSISGLTSPLSVVQGGTGANNKADACSNLGIKNTKIGDAIITSIAGSVVMQDGIVGAQQPIGAYNAQKIGGADWYTHYYAFNLPTSFSNSLVSCVITLVGNRGDQQSAEYPAFIRLSRDKNGGGASKNSITVAITTPVTGWYPYFNFSATGY